MHDELSLEEVKFKPYTLGPSDNNLGEEKSLLSIMQNYQGEKLPFYEV